MKDIHPALLGFVGFAGLAFFWTSQGSYPASLGVDYRPVCQQLNAKTNQVEFVRGKGCE